MEELYFQTKGLSVGYHGRVLIRDISLDIHKGEIVVLIGPNGSGKSTILKSITKQLKTLGGEVFVQEEELNKISYKELAKKQAVVLTQRMNPDLLTCYDIVSSGRYPYTGRMGILSEEDKDKVWAALAQVHAEELAECSFDAISDGQRQRILLARAICQEPDMIILDEPTSYLDVRHKLELLSILRNMAKEQQITVVMSLHEIDLAQKVADKIVAVKGDVIYRFGTPEQIFEEDLITELYSIENGSYDPFFGSIELGKVEGEPEVFVLAGGGTGAKVFRKLQKEGRPFAVGILAKNDIDYALAEKLAAKIVSEKAFSEIGEEKYAEALALMEKCGCVICTEFPVGPGNSLMVKLKEEAARRGWLK